MDAGAVGLSITYARKYSKVSRLYRNIGNLRTVSFTEFVLWVVRLYAASEMSMNSVERVAECKHDRRCLQISQADLDRSRFRG